MTAYDSLRNVYDSNYSRTVCKLLKWKKPISVIKAYFIPDIFNLYVEAFL